VLLNGRQRRDIGEVVELVNTLTTQEVESLWNWGNGRDGRWGNSSRDRTVWDTWGQDRARKWQSGERVGQVPLPVGDIDGVVLSFGGILPILISVRHEELVPGVYVTDNLETGTLRCGVRNEL